MCFCGAFGAAGFLAHFLPGCGWGVGDRDATVLAAAFASCRGFTEIVAYSHEDGLSTRAPGAVAVYDTDR
ncbi:ESX secretion-associated protein EspG, partial [Nocardia carnea]|uniref:ESX secretion-associated protein EspG n=1 Tax=Nocardia carnea TaxID=37328 RepID=UPI0032AED5D9